MMRIAALLIAGAAIACRGPLSDSPTMVVPRDTALVDGTTLSCNQCTLELVDSVRIGSLDDKMIPERFPADLLRDSRGTVSLVFNGWINKPILRYDSSGRYLGRLGGFGRGPGEYEMSWRAWLGPGDSTYVLAEGRIQAFGPDGSYGGSTNFAKRSVRVLGMTPAGQLIVEASRFRDTVSTPHILRYDRMGTLIDSFPIFHASYMAKVRRAPGAPLVDHLMRVESDPALSDDGSVWTTFGKSYRIEKHDSAGRPVRLFGMQLPGEPAPRMGAWGLDSVPVTMFPYARTDKAVPIRYRPRETVAIQPSGDSLVWVTRHVGAPSWDTITVKADKLSPDEAPDEETIPRDIEDRLYHSIIDIVDARTGALLARRQLPFQAIPIHPGYFARVTQDEDGFYVTRVYGLRFMRR